MQLTTSNFLFKTICCYLWHQESVLEWAVSENKRYYKFQSYDSFCFGFQIINHCYMNFLVNFVISMEFCSILLYLRFQSFFFFFFFLLKICTSKFSFHAFWNLDDNEYWVWFKKYTYIFKWPVFVLVNLGWFLSLVMCDVCAIIF